MTTFFEIEKEKEQLYQSLTTVEINEETGELIEPDHALIEKQINDLTLLEENKIDAIGFSMKQADMYVDFLKAEEKHIAEKRKAIENSQQRFKEYLKNILLTVGKENAKGQIHSLYLRKSQRVIIDCEPEKLPSGYVDVKMIYQPDKKLIGESLKKGQTVPGAHIEENITLNIR